MSAMDHSHLLMRLIVVAEASLQMRQEHQPDVAELVGNLLAENQKPTDTARVISDEITMCASAAMLAQVELGRHDRRRAAIFLRVVGVLLPEVRIALALAIEQRKRPTA